MFIRHMAGPCFTSWQITLGQQGALNQNPFGGLGHVRPVDAAIGVWQQPWLWVRLSCSGKHPWWQRLRVLQCSVLSSVSSQPDGMCWKDPPQAVPEGAGVAGAEHCGIQWLLWLGSPRFWAHVPRGFFALCASDLRGCEQLPQTGSYSVKREYPVRSEKKGSGQSRVLLPTVPCVTPGLTSLLIVCL